MRSIRKGDRVVTNVGRGKGVVCVVVGVFTQQVPTPDGGLTERVMYDVRTPNQNVLRRNADRIAPAKKGS